MIQSLTHKKRHSLGPSEDLNHSVPYSWKKTFFRSISRLEMIQSPTHGKRHCLGQ